MPQTFWDRLSLLHDSLTTGECWNDVDSIAVPLDAPSEDAAFTKSSAFFIHLFGLELHDSLAMLCKGALHVLATDEKCTMLEALQQESKSAGIKFQLHRVCKDNHESTHEILAKLVKSQAGRKIGCLEKIQFQSILALALSEAIQSACACFDNRLNLESLQVDI
jgi:nucleosome binding factor SPN SPT16 subunit